MGRGPAGPAPTVQFNGHWRRLRGFSIDREDFLWIYVVASLPGTSVPSGEYFRYTNGVVDPASRIALNAPTRAREEFRFSVLHYVLAGTSAYSFHFADDVKTPTYQDTWEIRTK